MQDLKVSAAQPHDHLSANKFSNFAGAKENLEGQMKEFNFSQDDIAKAMSSLMRPQFESLKDQNERNRFMRYQLEVQKEREERQERFTRDQFQAL